MCIFVCSCTCVLHTVGFSEYTDSSTALSGDGTFSSALLLRSKKVNQNFYTTMENTDFYTYSSTSEQQAYELQVTVATAPMLHNTLPVSSRWGKQSRPRV